MSFRSPRSPSTNPFRQPLCHGHYYFISVLHTVAFSSLQWDWGRILWFWESLLREGMELGQEHLASQVPEDWGRVRGRDSSFRRYSLALCLNFPGVVV